MDFKVAGTAEFVTALQLDTKLDGIPSEVLAAALNQAKDARLTILEVLGEAIDRPDEMSRCAPRVVAIKVPVDKIGEVIGPKGKMINSITEQTGADISIEDDGTIYVGASDGESAEAAIGMINAIANPQLPKIGERFLGTVVKTAAFGAFISLVPGKDGLVHISKLGNGKRIGKVEDVVKVGDKLRVEVTDIDNRGKISLIPVVEEEAAAAEPVTRGRAGRGLGELTPVTDVVTPGALSAPGVLRSELPGGLRVVTETVAGVRSVSLGIWIGIGSRDESPEQAGAAHYLEHLLFKGTRRRTAKEIAEELDAVGGDLNAFTAKEHTCYYAHVLDTDLPLAVDVLADVVTDATMHPLRRRDRAQGRARRDRDARRRPRGPARRAVRRGPVRRPPARPPGDRRRRSRCAAMSRETLHGVLAGAVHDAADDRRGRGQPACTATSSSWSAPRSRPRRPGRAARRPPARGAPAAALLAPGPRLVLRPEDTEQAHVMLGVAGLSRHDPRRSALSVLNTALGGGPSSRLFQQVREQRGLAYSVYSSSVSYADAGAFSVYAGCAPERLEEVVTVIRDVLAEVAARRAHPGRSRSRARQPARRPRARAGGHPVADEPDRAFRARLRPPAHGHRQPRPDRRRHPRRRRRVGGRAAGRAVHGRGGRPVRRRGRAPGRAALSVDRRDGGTGVPFRRSWSGAGMMRGVTVSILVAAVLIVIGLVGIVVPVLPGLLLVVVGIAAWAVPRGDALAGPCWASPSRSSWWARSSKYLLPGKRLKEAGVPGRTLALGAVLGSSGSSSCRSWGCSSGSCSACTSASTRA